MPVRFPLSLILRTPATHRPHLDPLYQGTKALPGINIPSDGGNGQLGLLYYMQATDPRTGQRSYARTAHWDDLNRPNYNLLVGTRVNKIIFEGKSNTAVGVQVTPRGGTGPSTVIKARKEVILAAGTIHTPQILQLSGIGPAKSLKQAGIKALVDLPGVGANFQDHTYVDSVAFKCKSPLSSFIPFILSQGGTKKKKASEWHKARDPLVGIPTKSLSAAFATAGYRTGCSRESPGEAWS